MKHNKTLKTTSAMLLSELNKLEKTFFNTDEARDILPDSKPEAVNELLRNMVKRGLLMRIKEGLYHIIPYEKDPETYMPDWHITGAHLADNTGYYLGYYTALSIHSLTTQHALIEQVVINRQINKKMIKVKEIEFQLIYHNPNHFFGATNIWINDFAKVKCSDIEKTILDCLFMPQYGSGIVEIAKALYKAKDSIDYSKLWDYIVKFDSQSALKRLGFLLELFQIQNPIIQQIHHKKTDALTLLDPTLPKDGKMLRRWSIQQNIDTETILSALNY
jgi:predicted transcriptional regulator of viral defense system